MHNRLKDNFEIMSTVGKADTSDKMMNVSVEHV